MTVLTDRTINALRASYDSLASHVSMLCAADLDRPSGSAEWDVAQVLGHLGSAAEIGLVGLRGALDGLPNPGQDVNGEIWDRWDAMGQREKAQGYLEMSGRLVSAYEALDEATRNDLRIDLGFLPQPADLGLITAMRLNEFLLHGWDVRVAFDRAAVLPAAEAGLLLEHLRGDLCFLLAFVGKPAAVDGATARLRVDVTEPEQSFGLLIEERISLAGPPADADGIVSGPTEAFVRLIGGRLDAGHTPDAFGVVGDVVSLDQLRRVFPGI